MMPSESACRNLAGRINEQAGDNTQAGAFLFGVFNLEGIREFQAIHEAKSIASQVYVRESNNARLEGYANISHQLI